MQPLNRCLRIRTFNPHFRFHHLSGCQEEIPTPMPKSGPASANSFSMWNSSWPNLQENGKNA